MSLGLNDWFRTITQHYGTLDQFSDARSIRIMHQNAGAEIREIEHQATILEDWPEHRADWIKMTEAEHALLLIQQDALKRWLADRGLDP